MDQLFGWITLLIVLISILIWTRKLPYIRNLILVAFLLRSLFVILGYYNLITLPDSENDSIRFVEYAKIFSSDYGLSIVFSIFDSDSYVYPKFLSLFFSVIDNESLMMAQSLSVIVGTISVYLVYHLSLLIWDSRSAKKAAWVATIFPSLILYSSLTLRECYINFFLLISLIGIVKFFRKKELVSFLQVIGGFYINMLLHGPMIFGGLIFLFYMIYNNIKNMLNSLYNLKIKTSSILILTILLIPIILYINDQFNIPYVGVPSKFLNSDYLLFKLNVGLFDTASYPSWLYINNIYEIFTKGLIKIIYFLYGPFIWNISHPVHLLGLFDGFLYIGLTICVIKNWKPILSNPYLLMILIILIMYLTIYGLGIGNFGTGIRHRSKFVVMIIVLAAPKLITFVYKPYKN
tara:strand:- start:2273 stop:3487 length:1215 start_codon:yes stop_codon:yes gene_type:complete